MIDYIKGQLAELNPTSAIVEACGVGYELSISLNTYTALQGKKEVKLYAYEVLREDAHLLFGFAGKDEREIFTLLIGVSGIGGMTARMLLSAFSPRELCAYIQSEDVKMLKSVKGIGPKAAQRIVVDLKDKVVHMASATDGAKDAGIPIVDAAQREIIEEAVAALTMLGFPPAAAKKAVDTLVKDQPSATVEVLIKGALKIL